MGRNGRTRLSGAVLGRVVLAVALVAASFVTLGVVAGELRVWTSRDGQFSTIAEMIASDDESVVLEKHDGRIIRVPIDKLSDEDKEFIRRMRAGGDTTRDYGIDSGSIDAPADTPKKSPAEVEREAKSAESAKDAVLVYQFYLARKDLTAAERVAAEKAMARWEDLAERDYVRMGRKWIASSEADAIREQAERKLEMAIEYLRLRNGPLAEQTLKEASALDPDSLQADFLMGVVYGLIVNDDRKAARHFEECWRRDTNCVSTLNNLAISLVMIGRHNEAVKHWQQAVSLSPDTPELTQNVATMLSVANFPRYRFSRKNLATLSGVYSDLLHVHKRPKPGLTRYLYYLPPAGVSWANFGGDHGSRPGGGSSQSVVVGSGTGWVIQPGVIVTNEHVVEDADGLLILDPQDSTNRLPASVIAVDKVRDLALVRCNDLKAPPVPVSRSLPPRGSDIMVLGYPAGEALGSTIKATRGAMVAMPDAKNEGLCLYDALTNPGNSGGPLCDDAGRVVGVVRAVVGDIGGKYGCAIPMTTAESFFDLHLNDLTYEDSKAEPLSWPEVDAQISPSTVLILIKQDMRSDLDWSREG